jgi:hypothetical protein
MRLPTLQDVEERIYPSKYWVCTEEFSNPETKDAKKSEMFMNLFRYIQGRNEGGKLRQFFTTVFLFTVVIMEYFWHCFCREKD